MKTNPKLTKFLNKYDGTPVTVEQFSKATGLAVGTIYNKKKHFTSLGVVFQHGTVGSKLVNKKIKRKTSETLTLSATNYRTFRVVLKFVSHYFGYPSPVFVDEVVYKKTIDPRISIKKCGEYLQKCLERKGFVPKDEILPTVSMILEINHMQRNTSTKEDRENIRQVFKDLFGDEFEPTEEQVKTVSMSAKVILKGEGYHFIQARAGTSKTTCINVTHAYLKKHFNTTVKCIAFTNKAVKELPEGSSTFHKHVEVYTGLKGLGLMSDGTIDGVVERLSVMKKVGKGGEFLIVDEATTLSGLAISTIKAISNNILFVGDRAQISHNDSYMGTVIGTLSEQFRFNNAEDSFQKDMTESRFNCDWETMNRLLDTKSVGVFSGKLKYRRDENGNKTSYTDYTGSFEHLEDVLKGYVDTNSAIIAYSTKACESINYLLNGGKELVVGSKVVLNTKVHAPILLTPADLGRVLEVYETEVKVLVEGSIITLEKAKLSLAYAISTLSAQGSAWDNVLYVEGTAPKAKKMEDSYTGTTRPRISCRVIRRTSVDTSINNFFSVLEMTEGDRNNSIYSTVTAMKDIIKEANYPMNEAVPTVLSGLGVNDKKMKFEPQVPTSREDKKVKFEPHTPQETLTVQELSNYTYVLIKEDGSPIHQPGVKRTLSKEDAIEALEQALENGNYKDGYIAEELRGGNRVVIDCDNAEMVSLFKPYFESTEGYISLNEDKMHLVFTVDTLLPKCLGREERGSKGLDFLTNSVWSLRNIKANKDYNGKKAIPLPHEVLELVAQYHPKLNSYL